MHININAIAFAIHGSASYGMSVVADGSRERDRFLSAFFSAVPMKL